MISFLKFLANFLFSYSKFILTFIQILQCKIPIFFFRKDYTEITFNKHNIWKYLQNTLNDSVSKDTKSKVNLQKVQKGS